jgi:phosphate acyltransferase
VKRKQFIGIDLMGSDNAPAALMSAAAALSPFLPTHIELIAIGTPDCEKEAKSHGLRFHSAREAIGMEESPLLALRRKKQSSLCIGLRLLKEGKLDAFVSAGNTGALVSASKMILGTFRDISRPALLALMPTKKRPVAVLDVGANLQAKAAQLVQFAHLGAAYQIARGILEPRIGILNIGSEASKGTSEIRLAYKELSKLYRTRPQTWKYGTADTCQSSGVRALTREAAPQNFWSERATIAERQGASENENYEAKPTQPDSKFVAEFGIPSFAGNIEGKSVFDGEVDVLVTDGFTGNVFLKTAEGIASLVLDRLHSHIPAGTLKEIAVHLNDLQRHLHYAEHPGALLCGVKGTVVKCHGYSTPEAFANGIRGAVEFASCHFIDILKNQLLNLKN